MQQLGSVLETAPEVFLWGGKQVLGELVAGQKKESFRRPLPRCLGSCQQGMRTDSRCHLSHQLIQYFLEPPADGRGLEDQRNDVYSLTPPTRNPDPILPPVPTGKTEVLRTEQQGSKNT